MAYFLVITILTAFGPYERAFEADNLRHCIAAGVDAKRHYEMRFDEPVSVDCVKRKVQRHGRPYTSHPLIGPLVVKGFYS